MSIESEGTACNIINILLFMSWLNSRKQLSFQLKAIADINNVAQVVTQTDVKNIVVDKQS